MIRAIGRTGSAGLDTGGREKPRRHSLRNGRPPPCREREPEVMRIGSRFWGGEPL